MNEISARFCLICYVAEVKRALVLQRLKGDEGNTLFIIIIMYIFFSIIAQFILETFFTTNQ